MEATSSARRGAFCQCDAEFTSELATGKAGWNCQEFSGIPRPAMMAKGSVLAIIDVRVDSVAAGAMRKPRTGLRTT